VRLTSSLPEQCAEVDVSQTYGPPRPVAGIALLFQLFRVPDDDKDDEANAYEYFTDENARHLRKRRSLSDLGQIQI
jgi:hypothetical protein